jgi:hypothetical protein
MYKSIMKKYISIIFLLILFSCNIQKIVNKQARKLADAMQNKNYAVSAKYTHPYIVKMLGGREKYIEILKTGHQEMNKIGYRYESIELGEPSDIVKAGSELHCIIPEIITMRFSEGIVVSKSALLGVSKNKGKSWTFIETAMLPEEKIKNILPNFNPSLKIPNLDEPEVIYNKN